jgi:hypothetical protein
MAQLSPPSLNPKSLAVVRERAGADVENKMPIFSVPIIGPMLTRSLAFYEAHNETTRNNKEGHSGDNANPQNRQTTSGPKLTGLDSGTGRF